MNKLFIYRLTLIVAQLCLLLVNHIWSFWADMGWQVWVLCGSYLVLTLVLQIATAKYHQNRYMLMVDLLHWSGFFYFLGGVTNPLIWCLLIPSVLSALSQSVKFTWLISLLANLAYGLLWWLGADSMDVVFGGAHGEHIHGNMMQQHITGMWLGFIAVSVLLTWVTTTLMQRLNAKNQTLLDYEKQRQADENIIKMATLATSMAHELGTPLASIKLLVNELRLSVDNQQQRTDLKVLDSQVDRCKKVLEELTAVTSKGSSDDLQVVAVDAFVEQLIQSLGAVNCAFKVINHEHKKTAIEADALLQMACMNILNNSITAGAQQVTITISETGKQALLSIKDDGMGENHHNQDGLGIGLKLSRRIVVSMGGSLDIMRDESGALVTIKIPIWLSL
ncbi:HAMP domain-containing sensor histidine kinase [Marinicella sp. S1101]|uniref:sensor histidine kinase n=1 Tax=Marinicella marina TaxID=2996016 RepID=UPI002260DFF7|nr:HAMP domain-containing sensor histidine kinase [Marinicella marina]MCX7553009.1 HAMP domain-containing sensor histidine kinase [Marinicella marina]MDJ1139681.1 HAMP domain-containing sensor histidine kinase [Marinicella marina]